MVIVSSKNVLFRNSGPEKYLLKKNEFRTDVPAWVRESWYFKALVNDGSISISDSTSDPVVEVAMEKAEVKATAKRKRTEKKE